MAPDYFFKLFNTRQKLLEKDKNLEVEFIKEMHRFLPPEQVTKVIRQKNFWHFTVQLIKDLGATFKNNIRNSK